jgi:hypothetical protein
MKCLLYTGRISLKAVSLSGFNVGNHVYYIPYLIELKLNTPLPESDKELYRPSDHRLSAKLVPTFAYRGCHVVSVTDPYGRILSFLDRSLYYFFQIDPQFYSRG